MRRSQDDELVPLYQPFETELRGFNRRQVLEHLESLDGRIAMVAADRDAALTQVTELSKVLNHLRLANEDLRREADKATSRVERVLATPMAGANARIQRIMRLAEEEAAELAAQTEAEATARIARADQDIADLRAGTEDEITRLRAHASREAKSLLDYAKRQRDQREADSAARRRAAERDAARAIAHREAAANARIRDSELRGIAGLHLMLQAIGEQLSTRVRTVERDESALRELRAQVADEVAALEALRTEITAALAAAHQLMAEALGQVQGPPVPIQRGAEGGTVYLLNTGTEERRSPRTSR
ncbi:MAG: hypothetical protein ACRDRW_00605 [Pseudonocardiaceae bacterium]